MENKKKLMSILNRIDGRGYKAYLDLKGSYDFGFFNLFIDHVQRDPFASPSLLRLEVPEFSFPSKLYETSTRKIALEDYIARTFQAAIKRFAGEKKGSGKSGVLRIDGVSQEILQRSCVNINSSNLEIRFELGLPARGRRILGSEAQRIIFEVLPEIVTHSCLYENINIDKVIRHVQSFEDAEYIRKQLIEQELVAFICDDAVLPRKSGVSDKPLNTAVKFKSPPSLEVSLETTDDTVMGMGIPEGVNLIVGGGYHGKSTLLRAVELGVYNHIPGDGREMVITREDAVKIRAEDGRPIEKVDISSFIHHPPGIGDTSNFSTPNASGSTSQAANIIEALEAGSKLILFDEDTSATNFMIRDERMQRLVPKDKEPITPFIDRVRELYNEEGVSTILVMGGSGDYFQAADTVILMDHYQPYNVTADARKVAEEMPLTRVTESPSKFGYKKRTLLPDSIKPFKGRRLKLDCRGVSTLMIGTEIVDLSQVEQLIDSSQTRGISYALYRYYLDFKENPRSKNSSKAHLPNIKDFLDYLDKNMDIKGLDFLSPPGKKNPHNIARPRRYEVAGAINRLRTISIDNP